MDDLMTSNGILFVIPARYDSERLPGKVLLPFNDTSSLKKVYRCVQNSARPQDKVVVALEHEAVHRECLQEGLDWIFTRIDHMCGTDRAAEVARRVPGYDKVIIVSADLPALSSLGLTTFAEEARSTDKDVLLSGTESEKSWRDPSRVKICMIGDTLYNFYREPSDDRHAPTDLVTLGLFYYKNEALQRFTNTPKTKTEIDTSIEMARLGTRDFNVGLVRLYETPVSLDQPEDYLTLKSLLNCE